MTIRKTKTLAKLEDELNVLKTTYGYGLRLKVRHIPNGNRKKSGEVIGNTIYVYADNPKIALDILRHEYLDQAVTREVIEPLVDLVNLQTSLIVKEIYKRKEELVERFSKGI